MEDKKFEYKAMKYDELPEDAKDKALEEMWTLNVDFEWWDDECTLLDWQEKYGIRFDLKKLCFDLDRAAYLYWTRGGIWVEDSAKLAMAIYGKGYNLVADAGLLEFRFETTHYGGGCGHTRLYVDDYRSEGCKDLPADAEAWFDDLWKDYFHNLRKEYDYLTSREAIEETIRINEYDFFVDGRRTRVLAA